MLKVKNASEYEILLLHDHLQTRSDNNLRKLAGACYGAVVVIAGVILIYPRHLS
jgi:hypothetical protein